MAEKRLAGSAEVRELEKQPAVRLLSDMDAHRTSLAIGCSLPYQIKVRSRWMLQVQNAAELGRCWARAFLKSRQFLQKRPTHRPVCSGQPRIDLNRKAVRLCCSVANLRC